MSTRTEAIAAVAKVQQQLTALNNVLQALPSDTPPPVEPPKPPGEPEKPPVNPLPPPVEPPPPPTGDFPRGTLSAMLNLSSARGFTGWNKRVVAADRITLVADPKGSGKQVFRVDCRPGDQPSTATDRAELYSNPNGFMGPGDKLYCATSFLLPADTYKVGSSYQIIWQIHDVGTTDSPPLSLRTLSSGISMRCRGGSDDNTKKDLLVSPGLQRDVWHEFIIFGQNGKTVSTGRVAVWHRVAGGTWKLMTDTRVETDHGNRGYIRMGIYSGSLSSPVVFYNHGCVFGNSFAEVETAMWGGVRATTMEAVIPFDDFEGGDVDDDEAVNPL